MIAFKDTPVAFTSTNGCRCALLEHAQNIQFYLDIEIWFKENPIDRKAEIQPDPVRFRQWLHGHRKTIAMILERFEDATLII